MQQLDPQRLENIDNNNNNNNNNSNNNGPSISVLDAISIPNVIGYSLAFGFFKFVNYSM